MFATTALAAAFLVLAVTANPIIISRSPTTLSVSKRINATTIRHVVKHDARRGRHIRNRIHRNSLTSINPDAPGVFDEPIDNQAVSYIANVGIGNPPTFYDLIVDTGSSNIWVGAGTPYVKTATSRETSNSVSVTYGSGSFSGSEFLDQVTITPGLVIQDQSIGVASSSIGFQGVDGIIGLGPTDLTLDTLSPATSSLVPTVVDNAFAQDLIVEYLIAVSFEPTTAPAVMNGVIRWGGTDSSKFTGNITFTPITTTFPAGEFWGINQSIRYGTTNILSSTAGIVDTGTTLLLIASDAFTRYQSATGAVLDRNTGLLRLTTAQFANLQSLFFTIGNTTFEFTANAQIWPRALNTLIGGTANNIYLIVGNLGTPTGEGLDFINGMVFLERFYAVFDTGNKRVGFANTPFTKATTN